MRWAGLAAVLLLGCTQAVVPPSASSNPTTAPVTLAPPRTSPTAVRATASPLPTATEPPTPTPGPTATSSAAATRTPQLTQHPTATPISPPPSDRTSPSAPANGLTVDAADVARHLDALEAIAEANAGIRASGTAGYDASADYVAGELEALGYAVERNPVEFTYFNEESPVALTVGQSSWAGGDWLHANLYSGEGAVTAAAETVGIVNSQATDSAGCDPSDWNEFQPGNIALVMSGGCFSRDKVVRAQEAGAVALISLVADWDDAGEVLRPTLLQPELIEIPSIVAGLDPIDELLAAAAAATPIELTVDTIEEQATDDNVIAEIAGQTDEVLMLGGHLDSVLDGPGLNDNASGVATLLALAESVAAGPQPRMTVRFGFWAAEEFGTFGSQSYVRGLSAADRQRFHAYVNLDMVGSPNGAHYVYFTPDAPPDGTTHRLSDRLLDAFTQLGASAHPLELGGGSDHVHFDVAGIPVGGVFSGIAPLTPDEAEAFGGVAGEPADPCYHLSCDTRTNVDVDTAVLFGSAVAAIVEELAL